MAAAAMVRPSRRTHKSRRRLSFKAFHARWPRARLPFRNCRRVPRGEERGAEWRRNRGWEGAERRRHPRGRSTAGIGAGGPSASTGQSRARAAGGAPPRRGAPSSARTTARATSTRATRGEVGTASPRPTPPRPAAHLARAQQGYRIMARAPQKNAVEHVQDVHEGHHLLLHLDGHEGTGHCGCHGAGWRGRGRRGPSGRQRGAPSKASRRARETRW